MPSATFQDYKAANLSTVGCGQLFSIFYFISFRVVLEMVFLNLFVAIILQGFEDTNTSDEAVLNAEVAEYFTLTWSKFDPDANGQIKCEQLNSLLFQLDAPMGWSQKMQGKVKK